MIDTSQMVPEPEICGENHEETTMLKAMLAEAKLYLKTFKWCPDIANSYYSCGVGGVVALFLVELVEGVGDQNDTFLWVVSGDLPSAYMVVEEGEQPVAALEKYCDLMEDWINAVLSGGELDDVYPINAPADLYHANMLKGRVESLRHNIIPNLRR